MFRFACSVALRGERGAADESHWRVWGALAVFRPHWFCPRSWHVCFPHLHCSGSRLLYRERALSCVRFQFSGSPQKRGLCWACVLCLPRSSSGRQELDGRTLPGCGAPNPLRGPSLSFRAMVGCERFVSVLRSWPLAATLPGGDVNHPESQEVFGWKLEACLQCGRGRRLWGRVCPFPPRPCLPPQAGDGPVRPPLALL